MILNSMFEHDLFGKPVPTCGAGFFLIMLYFGAFAGRGGPSTGGSSFR
jgi:hypothetical protein